MFFICAGHLKVTIAGREVARLEKGNFVGEVAFLTEKPATATVVAKDSVRALVFERAELVNSSAMKRKSLALSTSSWGANSHTRLRSATPCSLRQRSEGIIEIDGFASRR